MGKRRAIAAAVAGGVAAAYLGGGRSRQLRWEATDEESDATLPGDDLIATADLVATRAITIRAPADRVWPWIAQPGQGRGGFYTYDRLENLAGLDIHSATRIVPEWQHIQVGDQVRLAAHVGLTVTVADRGQALVIRGGIPSMYGRIKVSRWLPFRARQALAGLIPVAHGKGPDVSRSAAGRGAAEAVWVPAALLPRFGVTWSAAHICARYSLGETPVQVSYSLESAGRIRSLVPIAGRKANSSGSRLLTCGVLAPSPRPLLTRPGPGDGAETIFWLSFRLPAAA